MNSDPAPQSAPEPTGLIGSFLAAHDAPCPKCRYNLRGVNADRCPECGFTLSLGVVDIRRPIQRSAILVLVMLWLLLAGGMNAAREGRSIRDTARAPILTFSLTSATSIGTLRVRPSMTIAPSAVKVQAGSLRGAFRAAPVLSAPETATSEITGTQPTTDMQPATAEPETSPDVTDEGEGTTAEAVTTEELVIPPAAATDELRAFVEATAATSGLDIQVTQAPPVSVTFGQPLNVRSLVRSRQLTAVPGSWNWSRVTAWQWSRFGWWTFLALAGLVGLVLTLLARRARGIPRRAERATILIAWLGFSGYALFHIVMFVQEWA